MRGVNESISVYVVDDDDAVRDSLVALLEPEGFVIRTFSSVEEFLEELGENNLSGDGSARLLLDLHMPGKGGEELLAILAERDHNFPVIVMTGKVDDRTRIRVLKAGVVEFLEKPVDADHLIAALRNAHAGG